MRIDRSRPPGAGVCFVLSFLICCGGSADGGTGRAARDVSSGTAEAWVGRASGAIGGALVDGLETDAELTWVALPDQPVPGQTVYSAQGRVSYRGMGCTVTPADASIEPRSGARMVIDWTRSPPEYSASGASMWIARVSCGDAPVDAPAGGVWLADPSTFDQAARGALTDEDTIEGSATFGDPRAVQVSFHWAFRRAN